MNTLKKIVVNRQLFSFGDCPILKMGQTCVMVLIFYEKCSTMLTLGTKRTGPFVHPPKGDKKNRHCCPPKGDLAI